MLDRTDRKLLRILQLEGRITNQDLAARCAMSASACLERTRRLKEKGFIRSFAAMLDPALLDQSFLVFVEVVLERTTGNVFREFADAVQGHSEILECHMVAGGFDYLLKLRMRDMAAYRSFLATVLAEIPAVRETRTYAVMEEVKCTTALPV